jgi:hypothetical protein
MRAGTPSTAKRDCRAGGAPSIDPRVSLALARKYGGQARCGPSGDVWGRMPTPVNYSEPRLSLATPPKANYIAGVPLRAPFVYRLGRQIFNLKRRVRLP